MHIVPSGWQLAPQKPPLQEFEQHSLKATHGELSGLQGGWQAPSVQVPLQHSAPIMQGETSGSHGPQGSPQVVGTSLTQIASHCVVQQNGSNAQTWFTQALHAGSSGSPSVHSSCGHGLPPQMPPLQSL